MTASRETPPSDLLVYAARPTIRIDGEENDRASRLILAMEMFEQEGGLSSLQLRYSNLASHPDGDASLAFEDEQILAFGTTITVYAGEASQPTEVFRGKVTAFEAEFSHKRPPELVVHAEDALQLARMQRRTYLHKNVTVADIARTVAQRANLRPSIDGFDSAIGDRLQLNETDLMFLRRVLREYDGDLQVVGDELHVTARAQAQRDLVHLELYSQLHAVRVTADLAHQLSELTVGGWDPLQAQRVEHTASGTNLGPGSGRLGSRLLSDAVAERSEHLGGEPVLTTDEARQRAEAAYDQRARRFVLAEGSAVGNPRLRVGTHVELAGISPRFDNVYYVTSVCHRFDLVSGYTTDFEAECAYLGDPA
jgi:phage protein D